MSSYLAKRDIGINPYGGVLSYEVQVIADFAFQMFAIICVFGLFVVSAMHSYFKNPICFIDTFKKTNNNENEKLKKKTLIHTENTQLNPILFSRKYDCLNILYVILK